MKRGRLPLTFCEKENVPLNGKSKLKGIRIQFVSELGLNPQVLTAFLIGYLHDICILVANQNVLFLNCLNI